MGESLNDQQKESIIRHFGDAQFAEAMLKLVAQVKTAYESSTNAPLLDDFYSEAMRGIFDKGGRMALNRMSEEIRRLSTDAQTER